LRKPYSRPHEVRARLNPNLEFLQNPLQQLSRRLVNAHQ